MHPDRIVPLLKVQKSKRLYLPYVIADGMLGGSRYELFGQGTDKGNGDCRGDVIFRWKGRCAILSSKDIVEAGRIAIRSALYESKGKRSG